MTTKTFLHEELASWFKVKKRLVARRIDCNGIRVIPQLLHPKTELTFRRNDLRQR